jgi:hypothetical protein
MSSTLWSLTFKGRQNPRIRPWCFEIKGPSPSSVRHFLEYSNDCEINLAEVYAAIVAHKIVLEGCIVPSKDVIELLSSLNSMTFNLGFNKLKMPSRLPSEILLGQALIVKQRATLIELQVYAIIPRKDAFIFHCAHRVGNLSMIYKVKAKNSARLIVRNK